MPSLVIQVRLHEGRYHGDGDWPPCPMRLFQALVAGAGLRGPLEDSDRAALHWLEKREPPWIGAPSAKRGQSVKQFMPNNDLDTVGGDAKKIAQVRKATKVAQPWLFDARVPFIYAWRDVAGDDAHAIRIIELAQGLYRLGRGDDAGWAWSDLLDDELTTIFAAYAGDVKRPTGPSIKTSQVRCPTSGSLDSLERRFTEQAQRFRARPGAPQKTVVHQASTPMFRLESYDAAPIERTFELRSAQSNQLVAWPLEHASQLVTAVRDGAVDRLSKTLPARLAEIVGAFIGRRPDGSNALVGSRRVRIVPLPSIGHEHADRAIRRFLVQVPLSCPLTPPDVFWAFSGVHLGAPLEATTTETQDDKMLAHYRIAPAVIREPAARQPDAAESEPDDTEDETESDTLGAGAQPEPDRAVEAAVTWRTITPAVLPRLSNAPRRPSEAARDLQRAAIAAALRHAGISARVAQLTLQREPFDANGLRAEAFAPNTRFDVSQLWHVELVLEGQVAGPLVIGDGRYLGLGVMAPARWVAYPSESRRLEASTEPS